MTDAEKELRRLAQAAAEAVGPEWSFLHAHGTEEGWVESATPGRNIGTGYDGEWDACAGRFSAAADPKAVLALLDRIEALENQAAEAERKGVEEMRKAVVIRLREYARGHDEVAEMTKDYDIRDQESGLAWGHENAAEEVALLRLHGDVP